MINMGTLQAREPLSRRVCPHRPRPLETELQQSINRCIQCRRAAKFSCAHRTRADVVVSQSDSLASLRPRPTPDFNFGVASIGTHSPTRRSVTGRVIGPAVASTSACPINRRRKWGAVTAQYDGTSSIGCSVNAVARGYCNHSSMALPPGNPRLRTCVLVYHRELHRAPKPCGTTYFGEVTTLHHRQ